MKLELVDVLSGSKDLVETQERLLKHLRRIHDLGEERVGYVAGILTSDGPDLAKRNVRRLEVFTRSAQGQFDFPIFSATEAFGLTGLWKEFVPRYQEQDWRQFWGGVIESGQITDLVFTPRSRESVGTVDELNRARQVGGIVFHYIDWQWNVSFNVSYADIHKKG